MGKMRIMLRVFLLVVLGFLGLGDVYGQCQYVVPTAQGLPACPDELVQVTGFVPRGDGLLKTQVWRGPDAVGNPPLQTAFNLAFDSLDAYNLPIHRRMPSLSLYWPMVGINYFANSPTESSAIQYEWPECQSPSCLVVTNDNDEQGVEQAQQDGWLFIPDAVSCIRFSFSSATNKAAALYLSTDDSLHNLDTVLLCNFPANPILTADWTVPSGLPVANSGFRYTRLRLYHHDVQGLADTEVTWDIGDGFVTIPRSFFQSVSAPNDMTLPPSGMKAEKSFFAYRQGVDSLFRRNIQHSTGPRVALDPRYKQAVSLVRSNILTSSGCDTVADCGEIQVVLIHRYDPALQGGTFVQYWDPDSTYFTPAPGQQEYREPFSQNDNLGLPLHVKQRQSGAITGSNFLGLNLPGNGSAIQRTLDAWLAIPPDISFLQFQLGSGNGSQSSALWLGRNLSNMHEIAVEVAGNQTGGAFQLPVILDTAGHGWRWLRARLYVHDDSGSHDSRVMWDMGQGLEYIPRNFIRACTSATENVISSPNINWTLTDVEYGIQLPDGTVWLENGPLTPNHQISIQDTLDERVDVEVITTPNGQPTETSGPTAAATFLADPCNRAPVAMSDTLVVVQSWADTAYVLLNDTDPDVADSASLHITKKYPFVPYGIDSILPPDSLAIIYHASNVLQDFDIYYIVCDDGDTNLCDTAILHIIVGKDVDGDRIADQKDKDNDNDGISNVLESANARNFGDTDGDALPDSLDLDSDNDGSPDIVENGIEDPDSNGRLPLKPDGRLFHDANDDGWDDEAAHMDSTRQNRALNSDMDPIPDYLDLDADNDGIYDIIEIGMSQYDSLGVVHPQLLGSDGWDDRGELYPDRHLDNDTIPERLDLDSDNDGIPNLVEARIPDSDNDGMFDDINASDTNANGAHDRHMDRDTVDQDHDNRPNYLDLDADNDGIADLVEDGRPDPDSLGHLVTGFGDTDGNGWRDSLIAAGTHNPDLDLLPDFLDLDSDNDGLYDRAEQKALTGRNQGMVISFQDTLNNGWDKNERVPELKDKDGDGVQDRIDLDADNDGIPDVVEAGGIDSTGGSFVSDGMIDDFVDADSNGADDSRMRVMMLHHEKDSLPDYLDLDSDNDGILDFDEDSGRRGDSSGTVRPDALTDSLGWASSPRLSGRRDSDLDTIPDRYDLDSDNDGIYDLAEAMPYALLDTLDHNNDGRLDSLQREDKASWDSVLAKKTAINTDHDSILDQAIPDYIDLDSDNDGLSDIFEDYNDWLSNDNGQFSPSLVNVNGIYAAQMRPHREDHDGDSIPDFRDLDSDQDGIADAIEAGYRDRDSKRSKADGMVDGPVNAQGWRDAPLPGNVDQDGDKLPPHLDRDSDSDGIPDLIEANCVFPRDHAYIFLPLDTLDGPNGWDDIWAVLAPLDTDFDGKYDFLDGDSDGDGISDLIESDSDAVDIDGNQMIDDTIPYPDGWNSRIGTTEPMNTDSDAIALKMPDYRDLDSDNDGLTDEEELLFDFQGIDCDTNGTPNWRDIFPCNVHFYQGFSPNGDGINDEFIVEGIDYHRQDNVFTVMNRWGVVMYKMPGWDGTWDGLCNVGLISAGTPAPVGIYFYTFQYQGQKEPQKGYIYLRR